MFKNSKINNNGFTLIELLVVIAIIGILSTIVIASLNSAREKGKIALIKSTLKNLGSQIELNYLDNSSYTGTNPSYSDLTCTGISSSLSKIVQPLIDQGIYVKCFSYTTSGDVYKRYGATAIIYDTTELKAWSVDERGVAKWDLKGVNSSGAFVTGLDVTMNWSTAINACATSGGHLPSIEQLRTLSYAWYSTPAGSYFPNQTSGGFRTNSYWSSTPVPSSPESISYYQNMNLGSLGTGSHGLSGYVRCIR
jgi:prepilin-type N-terminal cleavage/methylation domain-containing protein